MKVCGIYKITSPTGKIYIGQSTNINRRFYIYRLLHCKPQAKLYGSLKKHGVENHLFEIIHECDRSELNPLEEYYINKFDTLNCGLNLKPGGDAKALSDSTKGKISRANSGSKNGMYGTRLSKERIEFQRTISAGDKSHLARPILNTETGIFYPCLREAAESVNSQKGSLWVKMVKNKTRNTPFIYA